MAKFVEMDERTKFKDQTEEKIGGPVILINKFNVHPDKVQQFLNDWAEVNKILFSSEPQSRLLKYDDNSLVISPHLFKKVAVPGICSDF